jgi:Trp operon repressor
MVNVSKIPLEVKTKQKLFKEFARLFSMSSERKMGNLFLELFTESEQIMFIKRVGIVLMLCEGYSNYMVAKTLKVSPATVRSIQEKFFNGEYDQLVEMTKKSNFDTKKFWKVMEVVLRGGLPSRSDRKRWGHVLGTNNQCS